MAATATNVIATLRNINFSLAVKGFAVCQLRAELSSKSWPFLYWYSRIVWKMFSATVSSALAPHSAAPSPGENLEASQERWRKGAARKKPRLTGAGAEYWRAHAW